LIIAALVEVVSLFAVVVCLLIALNAGGLTFN
jgi:F-type H+-transporting ATPase subunit c